MSRTVTPRVKTFCGSDFHLPNKRYCTIPWRTRNTDAITGDFISRAQEVNTRQKAAPQNRDSRSRCRALPH